MSRSSMIKVPAMGNASGEGLASASAPSWIDRIRARPVSLATVAALALLAWAFGPNLYSLVNIWRTEDNYSHGFLVVPIAVAIFWKRLSETESSWEQPRAAWWGWGLGLLVLVLAGRAVAYENGLQWTENATIIPAVGCVLLSLGGWPLLAVAWPAVLYLVFMLPLPPAINNLVANPLQRLATIASCFMFQLTGMWVVAEGNVINLRTPRGSIPLEVAQACNGLAMLMTLAATVTATVVLLEMSNWKRIVVLLSAVPIALVSNVARIVVTGWCYYLIEGEKAKHYAHDISGWMMMPLALLLVAIELGLLSWLGLGEEDPDADRPIGPFFPRASS